MTRTGGSSMFAARGLKLRSLLLAMAILVLGTACDFLPETRSWTEDVQLDDGSVITVKRYVKFTTSNSLAGDVPSAFDKKVTLRFTGALAHLPTWNVPLMPLVLYQDVQAKEWVIVVYTSRCEVWDARGQPFPPYWEYRLVGGQWREQPLSESSKGRATNLLIEYRTKSLEPHVGLKRKQAELSNRLLPDKYRRIVPDVRRHCMVNAR